MEPLNDNTLPTNKICSVLNNFLSNEEVEDNNIENDNFELLNNQEKEEITLNKNPEEFNLNSSNKNNFDFTPSNVQLKSISNNKNIINKHSSKKISIFDYESNPVESKSFIHLQKIQKLLKKESALKELFIKTSSETLKSIENECREIYKKKLEVFTQLQRFSRKEKEVRKYFLVDDETQKKNLKQLYNYIPKFLLYLWDEPKIIVKLLQNSNLKDIKNHLAPLIINNFYENILSVNYIEENFLYILCLLLKDEINQLNSTSDVQKFLQETPCGCLLDQLIHKNDIKSYFKIIIQNIVENIEINCSEKEMNLNKEKIEKEIEDIYNNNKKGKKKFN